MNFVLLRSRLRRHRAHRPVAARRRRPFASALERWRNYDNGRVLARPRLKGKILYPGASITVTRYLGNVRP
jgi:hypothetical protein